MKCHVDECGREAMYRKQRVCQKHYVRYWRNGTYGLKAEKKHGKGRTRKPRYTNPAGYILIDMPGHALSGRRGYVYEHRYVYYEQVSRAPSECAMCGSAISWDVLHIDHIDCNKANNSPANLRAVCRACNVFRGHSPTSMGKHLFTADGRTMTASAWARVPGVLVSAQTIVRRRQMGMSDYDCIFAPRITHHGTTTKKIRRKYDGLRGISKEREQCAA